MKTKWHLYILWGVLSLSLRSCAADPYESLTRRKKFFKLGTTKSKPFKLSTADGQSSHRLPASTSPLSDTPPAPATPRSVRPDEPRAKIQADFAYLPDVSVTCSTSDLVVRVKPAFFYGLSVEADELKLGRSCRSNGVLRPYGDLLFAYPLTACDAVRQSPRGYLVYKFVLHYEPSPKRFPSRAHRIDVDIECRYQRSHHVYQLTVQPTWKTAVVRKRLKGSLNDFQIELMDDSWSRSVKSQVYQLGKTVNFQVSAPSLPSGGKLYINNCYATPSGSETSLKYNIIGNFGCMLDSRRDPGASQFISRTDKTLRFSLKAFQFTSDPDTELSVHCQLFVTREDPGPAQKSCTYRGNRWKALTGEDSICECCDLKCVTSQPRGAMMRGSASSGSLLVSDQPYVAEDGFLPVSPTSDSMSSEGEASIIYDTDEHMWRSADVVMSGDDDEEQDYTGEEEKEEEQLEGEGGVIIRVMSEPDLEAFGFEEKNKSEARNSSLLDEDGSGFLVQEHSSASEEEEEEGFADREDEISDAQQVIHLNQEGGEVLEQMLPSEVRLQSQVQPLFPEGEHGERKGGGMEASETEWKNNKDVLEDTEKTWYFTWR